MVLKVISGGQTGVDQAALRAALACGLALGGWCPPGRASEAGPIPAALPLTETPTDRSPDAPAIPRSLRTEWNVRDSDATLVLFPARPTTAGGRGEEADPGTGWALRCAARLGRPALVCDPEDPVVAARIARWIRALRLGTLHVAGPAESTSPGIGAVAERVLSRAFAAALEPASSG
jgi:hypothetical protein